MVPVLFTYGLPTEKLTNKYGSSIKDIDFHSRGVWYVFRPGYRLFRISGGVPTVPIRPGYRLFPISGEVPTVPKFGRGTNCYQIRPEYRLFPVSAGIPTVPNFGHSSNCFKFRPRYRLSRICAGVGTFRTRFYLLSAVTARKSRVCILA